MSFIIIFLLPLVVLGGVIYLISNNMKISRYTLQKIALALSIVVVLNLFFNYGTYTFYPPPQYDDFCTEETRKYYDNKESCEAIGGEWAARDAYYRGDYPVPARIIGSEEEPPTEYCDTTATCRKQYDEANSLYNRNVFVVLVVLGTISLVLGFFLVAVSAVSAGFLFGGLLSLFIGTTRYWSDMNDYIRFIVLGIVLAILIWLGYRKLQDKEKTKDALPKESGNGK